MTDNIVIAGAGHAAGQIIASLRQLKFAGKIVLVGDEPWLPYQRPPLSKKFLAGEMAAERLFVKPPGFYDDPQIDLRLETTIVAIDRGAKELRLAEGDPIAFDKLILALGSRPKELTVPGADLDGVYYLRNIADVEAIRSTLESRRLLVVIGAGYIGLEVAAVARQRGLDVTVVEMADRVMSRVVSPEISDFYQIEHTNQGVAFRLGTGIAELTGKRRVKAVITSSGEEISTAFVVVGIGIEPNIELAADAGIDVDDGIVVDEHCRSSDPNIYAVGDCTRHPNSIYGRRLRLESVHNALEQAKTAASNICGKEIRYAQVPWFWSDQYDLKLQIAGLSEGYDDVVIRGNPAEKSFACLYLKDRRLIAVDAVNAARDFVQSKPLIADHALMDIEKLADAEIALKDLAIRE
jgi:3-phenylpropionate/trans-cinnamate dioxygenase ferredoxin reductase subunit